MFKLFSILIIAVFVLLGVVVGILNPVSVELNLFVTRISLPLSVVMSALLATGMAIGGAVVFMEVIKLRWLLRAKQREKQKLSDQIVQLKKTNLKIKEDLTKESKSLISKEI